MIQSPRKLDYVSGVSWPRSGHHLLVRILGDYFGEGFTYCEFYKEQDCCKMSPCVRQDSVTFSKNHDYDSSLDVKAGQTYLVQYRKFENSLVSDFELHVRHIGIDTADEFKRFAQRKLASYKLFMHRWATVKASNTRFALLSYESLTADPAKAMRNILPLFAPDSPIDEQRLADVIANASQITISEGRSVKAEQKGVVARRDVRDFRYYDAVLFEKIEREAEDAYNRMNRLPLLRQYGSVSALAARPRPASLNIDITGMLDVATEQPTGIPRIQNFLLEMALADPDPAVGVVIFDPELRGYRRADSELEWFKLIQVKPAHSNAAGAFVVLQKIRAALAVARIISSKKADRTLASYIADRSHHPLLHSFFKRLIKMVRLRHMAVRSRDPALRNIVPLDLSNSIVLQSHMAVFGSGFHDTLGVEFHRAFICHDLIPWSRPDYAINTQSARLFVSHLKVLVETGVHALSMSGITDQTLGRYVASVDSAAVRRDRFAMPAMLYDLASRLDMAGPLTAEQPFILYCSTVEVRKNHILLARIWQRALQQGVALPKLVCAGKRGWGIEALDTFLAEHPELRSHIEFRGQVSDAELIDLYRSALFGVMPSLDEGWGLPVSECLDFGTPILVSRIPALLEASQGLMPAIDPLDDEKWFEAIKHLSADAAARNALRDTIRQRYHRVTPQESWKMIKSHLLAHSIDHE